MHPYLALLRRELPGQHVRDGAVEGDADAFAAGGGNGVETGGGFGFGGLGQMGRNWLSAPAGLLTDLWMIGKLGRKEEGGGTEMVRTWPIQNKNRNI